MKHTKKSLFITTVMMVVLLVVAISTATFAWYTSSNTVNTVATQVNSAESTGANISIGWADNTPVGVSSLEFVTNENDFSPMVPAVKEGTSFSFDSDTLFYTANISYGTLTNHATTTPYVGKSAGGSDVFYIINYARKATNIRFSANITGENAARLRVAVFTADGTLVYTNADIYYGIVMDPDPEVFTMTESEPAGWADNYSKYSTSGTEFIAVTPVAPAFQKNIYWTQTGTILENEPADWAGNYANYSTSRDLFVPVVGVAPEWEATKYWAYTPAVGAHLVAHSTQTFPQVNIPTPIGSSDGVTGVAQGFTVKAWFDGPTQVDAYGGKDALFTLTATATNVD